jgi:glycosyltransferase involved in cell wall biosynthesis
VSSTSGDASPAAVTAVIAFFDSERYLAEAVDSVLAQTHAPIELILVDDGSSDRSPEIARSYSPPARYLRRENGGPAAARNTGLAQASGSFVAFLDSDNRWLPRAIELQLAAFADDPALDVVFAQAREFVSAELDPSTLPARPPRDGTTGVLVSSMLARRSVFDCVGLFDERLRVGEWVDWYARLHDSGCRVEVLPHVTVERRIHAENNTVVRWDDGREYAQVLKAALDRRRGGR